MSKKTIALIFLVIVLPVVIYLLWPSDAGRIKKLFREGARAIETKDVAGVMSNVSLNYRDKYGFTYLYIKESLKAVFQEMSNIRVERENLTVDVKGKSATADMDVRVIVSEGDETGYVMGDASGPVHLTFTLEKERTKWLIVRTQGLPFDEQKF
ncbi:MAG TPA: nuclear transport factor 2 family protein [Thermodesulfovibrionales bacterium]|nr:nuclear transport factor 2 family protein [Thermodesulfovibrionales bacterium]